MIQERHDVFRTNLHRAQEELAKAREQLDEYSAKLKAVEAEIRATQELFKEQAEKEKKEIIQKAEKNIESLLRDAKESASGLYGQLKKDLLVELGATVIQNAEDRLKKELTQDDHSKIRKDFSYRVEKGL